MDSARKSYISKSLKRIETVIYWTVFKYPLVFDKEFKRKLVNLISAGSFIKNNNVYDFKIWNVYWSCLSITLLIQKNAYSSNVLNF